MKIRGDQQEFLHGIQYVQNVISQRATLPILSHILIKAEEQKVTLSGTDLEVGVTCPIPVSIEEEGGITLPARKFADIIKELPVSEVVIHAKKNNMASIECGKVFFRIAGLPKEDFPKFPSFGEKETLVLPQKTFQTMIQMTSFAMSFDETRYVLNGVFLKADGGRLTLVATDGRRLALIEKTLENPAREGMEMVVPTKAIQELNRILKGDGNLKIFKRENQVLFDLGEASLITRLVEGEYPNYQQVIPKETGDKVRIDRQELLQATRRASLLTSQESQSVKFDVLKDKVVVSKSSSEIGEAREELEAQYRGKEFSIGFNPHYLIDGLKNINDEEVHLELEGPEKPGVIRTKDRFIYIVLPMQLS